MHCPRPLSRLSFFASTTVTSGAVTTSCKPEAVSRKSHTPLSPRSGSASSGTPENSPSRSPTSRRSSSNTGAMMNSERAFSVLLASATPAPMSSWDRNSGRGSSAAVAAKRSASRPVRPRACCTWGKVTSPNAIGFPPFGLWFFRVEGAGARDNIGREKAGASPLASYRTALPRRPTG